MCIAVTVAIKVDDFEENERIYLSAGQTYWMEQWNDLVPPVSIVILVREHCSRR